MIFFNKNKYDILYKRGNSYGAVIIKKKSIYYLIDLDSGKCIEANPPDMPDMFLKFDCFNPIANDEDIPLDVVDRVNEIVIKIK